MNRFIPRLIFGASIVVVTSSVHASALSGDPNNPDKPGITEVLSLPQYCWYMMGKTEPQFTINNCGSGMNHYCPSLVALNRSMRASKREQKVGWLQSAEYDANYTLKAMQPECPIKADVERTVNSIKQRRKIVH